MNNSRVIIVMYHYVRDLHHSKYPRIKGLDIHLFLEQIEFFKNNFNIVSMEELIEYYKYGKNLPDRALLMTFDDGYIDNYVNVFPALRDNGLQGSFFIPGKVLIEHSLLDVNKIHYILASSDISELTKDVMDRLEFYNGKDFEYESPNNLYKKYAIANRFDDKDTIFVKRILQTVLPEKLRNTISSELFSKYVGVDEKEVASALYMTYDHLDVLRRNGMFIGIHGYDHYWLANLDVKTMEDDISKALNSLESFINRDAWVRNYPYGNYNEMVIDYVKKNGCIIGLSTEARVADLKYDNKYCLPRLDCNDFPPISDGYKKFLYG